MHVPHGHSPRGVHAKTCMYMYHMATPPEVSMQTHACTCTTWPLPQRCPCKDMHVHVPHGHSPKGVHANTCMYMYHMATPPKVSMQRHACTCTTWPLPQRCPCKHMHVHVPHGHSPKGVHAKTCMYMYHMATPPKVSMLTHACTCTTWPLPQRCPCKDMHVHVPHGHSPRGVHANTCMYTYHMATPPKVSMQTHACTRTTWPLPQRCPC